MKFDPNWVSAVAAVIAVALSIIAHRSAGRSKRRADTLEEKNAELTEMQTRLAHQSWSDEYFREITVWACQVSRSLSTAIHIVALDESEQRLETLITLSACIDMGRWYFPNLDHDNMGQDKEPAYRGSRQPVLDWVVWAYDIIDGRRTVADRRDALVTCQRNFVSCIQEVLDPRTREQAIERVLEDFGPIATLPKVKGPV